MNVPQKSEASACSANPVNIPADHPLTKIEKIPRLPYAWPAEDKSDAAQNIAVRLLEEARDQSKDVGVLMEESPEVHWTKVEAERSRVRRRLAKAGKELTAEMADKLPAEAVLSEAESAEVIEKAAAAARLSPRERQWLHLRFTLGIEDTDALSERMGVNRAEVHRVRYDTLKKLAAVPETVLAALKDHERTVEPTRCDDGIWRKPRTRNL
jgi:hypothetical protein